MVFYPSIIPPLILKGGNLDWTKDLETKFGSDDDLNNLKSKRFYGSIQINFSDGKVTNIDLRQHKVYTVETNGFSSISVYESYSHRQPTLKKEVADDSIVSK